ncbi:MAG: AmmeMemoRadiSam system radical SAM enzyme [Dissulfurimicrobium sp.]|uniref:AmmeMemoRadiSam system radical SAM enzyme n=1 Tax=Dissulfurimicrobium sp. TaxID=2022436 RepID=UPI003D09E27A
MKEALFYETKGDKMVKCELCNHFCQIKTGGRGICGVRENQDGRLVSLVYGRLVSTNLDPIEKKPLFNFLPGSTSYSISTVGCNFRCLHCQNWQISQYPRMNKGKIIGDDYTPDEVVEAAVLNGAKSISYTYVEPTIFYEFAYDCAVIAKKKGIRNVFVSNGFMAPDVTRHLVPVLDAINIDIKGFTERFYREVCKAKLKPVLDNVKLFHELGAWVEVTTLIIPGLNDSPEELRDIARFIKGVSPAMPWHVTAFYPTYMMMDKPPTPISSLRLARRIGLEEGLKYVYEGNISGEGGENTYCPSCGSEVIKRHGFWIKENRLENGGCPDCKTLIEGVWK